jgi:tellurite methyltransferase
VTLPRVDFIWAGLSLPFCHPDQFPELWEKITEALRTGGRVAGDLFGVRHAWRENAEMTFVTVEEVRAFLQPFEIEVLTEVEEERSTAFQGMQHWHGFDVIARKL